MNSISTNILRDENKELDYVVTPNAKHIFNDIFKRNNVSRSFTLIGNYGTGKSTFLWAMEKNLNHEKLFFEPVLDESSLKGFDIVKLVGENDSLTQSLAKALSVKDVGNVQEEIIKKLTKKRLTSKKNKKGFVLIIDEFGKFLEFASKNNPNEEMYLLQLVSEWANDESFESYFITTLHQGFGSYGNNLGSNEKREWEKIKGRFIDLLFNEPVEQLVFFAAEALREYVISEDQKDDFNKLNRIVSESNLIGVGIENESSNNRDLFPLDWLSVQVLVSSLQRYGQNERSLFSFLNDTGSQSIKNRTKDYYTVSDVFDYLSNNLALEINSPDNPHRAQWYSTYRALERSELFFNQDFNLVEEVVKTIGLVNIFARSGGLFDKDFLVRYFNYTRNEKVGNIIDKLQKHGVIRFYKFSNKLNFLEGTDLDIEQELLEVSKDINPRFNLGEAVRELVELPVVSPKKYTFETGTPRFFEFKVFESVENISFSEGVLDGAVNMIFEDVDVKGLNTLSKEYFDNIFVVFLNHKSLRKEVLLLKKYDAILVKHKDDINAQKLILSEREYHLTRLNELVLNDLFNSELNKWIWKGRSRKVTNKKELQNLLSKICFEIYNNAPVFRNELVNKEVLSVPINTARKYLFRRILSNIGEVDLGFNNEKYPPEKAIFISLLKNTGIYQKVDGFEDFKLSKPQKSDSKFDLLWDECESFLKQAITNKKKISELYYKLSIAPFKLKKGLVDFWIPIFLIAKKQDYALFYKDGGYVPFLSEDTIDLLHRKPEDFLVKSYDVTGLKFNLLESYKELVQLNSAVSQGTEKTFLSIYSNFLRFNKSLTEYAANTKTISLKAQRFREAIKQAKDPEEALFNSFPKALSYNEFNVNSSEEKLKSFAEQVQLCIHEIRSAYDLLLDRVEEYILYSFKIENQKFPEYKDSILSMMEGVNSTLLNNSNKVFYQRLISPLDDRKSWLKSVADAALAKSIDKMIDEEEGVLKLSIEDHIVSLLRVGDIHKFNIKNQNAKLISFDMIDESGMKITEQLAVSKGSEYSELQLEIKKVLSNLSSAEKKEVLMRSLAEEIKN